jgi:addiction module RelE/StbE family toxin
MKVRWLLSALAGVRAVRFHIAEENPQVADAVAARIERAVLHLEEFPSSGRIGELRGTREVVVTGLPYVLVYRVTDSEVQVLRLFHQKQDRLQ